MYNGISYIQYSKIVLIILYIYNYNIVIINNYNNNSLTQQYIKFI